MFPKRVFYLLFIFLIFTLTECSKNSPTSPDNFKELWPLKVGNFWKYVKSTNLDSSFWKLEVIGTKKIQDEEVQVVLWENLKENYRDTILYRSEDDGIYGFEKGKKFLLFKYPVKTGDKWSFVEEGEVKCISTNTQIQTPAGKFSCIVYQFSRKEEDNTLKIYLNVYMHPGVGWIASEIIEDTQPTEWFYLKSYHLN